MNTRVFNLSLMAFWLALAIGLLTREWWMPADMQERMNIQQMPLVIGVSFMLAGWNFMRFFVARKLSPPGQLSPAAQEIRRKIRANMGPDPKVTDPQFDFDRQCSDETLK